MDRNHRLSQPLVIGALVVALVVAAAAGLAAYRRRPVKPPARSGSWQPVDSQRTSR